MDKNVSLNKKGRILFIPMCNEGHTNYTIPIAKRFLQLYGDKGEVHFAVTKKYKEKIGKQVSEAKFSVYEEPSNTISFTNSIVETMKKFGDLWTPDPVKSVYTSGKVLKENFISVIASYPILTKIIKDVMPDLIILDQLSAVPFGIDQGIPWCNLFSCAMSYIGCHPKMPPPRSGFPTKYTPENVKKWEEFIDKAYEIGPQKEFKELCNNFLMEHNCLGLENPSSIYKISPYLNIYAYPKELDFLEEDGIKFSGNWLRIETPVMKPFPDPLPVPHNLKNLPGKLIYFSLGSMASSYKPLMEKMLKILAQLSHRFIVSTGMIGEQYTLADNMYGQKYLNQFAVLQTVDMVISHGGNNTLTETFNFGKPLIILPLFADQPDNAQRVEDKGLGKRLSIFDPEDKLKQDLIKAIEYCSQESVVLKMKRASERIQKDSGLDRVCEELSKFLVKK